MRKMTSLITIGTVSYLIYRNRYKIINAVFGNMLLRRLFVSSVMSVPGVRNKMVQSIFSKPVTW